MDSYAITIIRLIHNGYGACALIREWEGAVKAGDEKADGVILTTLLRHLVRNPSGMEKIEFSAVLSVVAGVCADYLETLDPEDREELPLGMDSYDMTMLIARLPECAVKQELRDLANALFYYESYVESASEWDGSYDAPQSDFIDFERANLVRR